MTPIVRSCIAFAAAILLIPVSAGGSRMTAQHDPVGILTGKHRCAVALPPLDTITKKFHYSGYFTFFFL